MPQPRDTHLVRDAGLLQPHGLLGGALPLLAHLQDPGHDARLLPAADVRVGIEHGARQRRARPGHAPDEDERLVAVVAPAVHRIPVQLWGEGRISGSLPGSWAGRSDKGRRSPARSSLSAGGGEGGGQRERVHQLLMLHSF